METDPLQQLRDVHLPVDPGWWPPAIGWWVLSLVAVALLVWVIRRVAAWWRKGAPRRQARKLHNSNLQALASGELSATAFAQQCNELLKRLLAIAHQQEHLAGLTGEPWLQALDHLSGAPLFTQGAGRALGEDRFRPEPQIDAQALGEHVTALLNRVRAP